jgi:hypothetical protein
VWDWFQELSCTAPATGMGAGGITHQQILAWCRLRRVRLLPLELDWLFMLDLQRLVVSDEKDPA